jgi:hypothetical protein
MWVAKQVHGGPRADVPTRLAADAGRLTSLRAIALAAIEHGWPVLPGSDWQGFRYRNAITGTSTRGLVPVVPRERATVEEDQVRAWWAELPHSVLVVTGRTFDVISVPMAWGKKASKHTVLRSCPTPMILTPDLHAHFLVALDSSMEVVLPAHPNVTLSQPGSVVPVPPTRMVGHLVRWEIRPERSGWQPGNRADVRKALMATAGSWSGN